MTTVFVKKMNGELIPINLEKLDTKNHQKFIFSMKKKIRKKDGMPILNQNLVFLDFKPETELKGKVVAMLEWKENRNFTSDFG